MAARTTVTWPRDEAKLDRVRSLMADEDLDALVVRAPDNVLYLTNFWPMKGYDAAVFPRTGDPVLICLEASADDASRTAWTRDVRLLAGYAPDDPRPPFARTLDLARDATREYERVGIELSLGTQASDRMVGEPTTFTAAWFDAFPEAADATPLLVRARSRKTEQEVERLRLANEIAAAAMEHVRGELRVGMTEAQAAALWQGFVHGEGTGWHGKSMSELDRKVREMLAEAGFPGQPTHPICHGVGARAHEPPYPHQAGGGEFEDGMVLAVEPGAYWPGGGGLRVEDNFLVTGDGVEKLSSFPDGVVRCPT